MNDKNTNNKNLNSLNPATEAYVIPYEAACSHEFSNGCFLMEEETDTEFDET